MFDIQKLIAIVTDALDDNAEMIRHNIQIRANMGLPKDALLWVPTMKGDVAYRTGELTERQGNSIYFPEITICNTLGLKAAI